MSDDPDLEMPPDPNPLLLLCDEVILRGHTAEGFPFERSMRPCIVNITPPEDNQ